MKYELYRSILFFFFKQKTAYEMRISHWSSDVCSSDLNDTPEASRSSVYPVAEDAGGRPTRWRDRTRLQQSADRDDRLLRSPAVAASAGRRLVRRYHADQAECEPCRQSGPPAHRFLASAATAAAGLQPDGPPSRAFQPAN